MKVYLDYAATAPVKPEVFSALAPYLKENFGNPSSIHQWGQSARKGIDEARTKIAHFLNCQTQEIIFTSGGTEADNLAIRGIIENRNWLKESGNLLGKQKIENGNTNFQTQISKPLSNFHQPFSIPHIITSQIEHHAVLKSCQDLEKRGLATVTYIRPNKDGIIDAETIKKAIKLNTILVSIMYVNNEIGTIQPIREIGKLLERENRNRLGNRKLENGRIYFHTDAVQATEYLAMNVDWLHVDMLTISGHKIGAPKGIGALYLRKGTPIKPIIHGGEQEGGLRAGTENVAGLVGLAKAVEMINISKNKRIEKLKSYFIQKILREIPGVELNSLEKNLAPHIVNLYFKHIEGESIVLAMDLEGIACSTGSACTSQSLSPSHVIMAVYQDPKRAAGSVRFSFNQKTTKEEIDFAIDKLKKVVQRLRKISPYGH